MYMKTKTKIIIVLFVVLYVGFIIFVKTAERKLGVADEQDKGIMGPMRKYFVEIDYDEILRENKHLLDSSLILDLNKLKLDDEYHFEDMFWNISLLKVKKNVPYNLIDVSKEMQLDEGYSYYASGQMYDYDGENVTAFYEFEEDSLKKVDLIFVSAEKPQELFGSIVQSLHDLCGESSESIENATAGENYYKWQAENSWLKAVYNGTNITISLGVND